MLKWIMSIMIKLGTWVAISNISDINIDYLVCAALATSSFMIIVDAGRRLGRSKGFKRRILVPLAQESSRVAAAIINFGLSQVQDVKATRISCYARSYSYYRTCSSSTREHFRCRPPSSSRFPERRTFLNRRHCALLALIFSSNASQLEAFTATAGARKGLISAKFDTDSFTLGLDSECSRGIGFDKSQFKDLRPWNGPPVKGVGTATITGIGTMCFSLECDSGKTHLIEVTDCVLVPSQSKALLAPQWLASNCAWTSRERTVMTIGVRDAKLIFGPDAEYTLTVPLDPIKNVPDVKVNQGITQYESFSAHVEDKSNTMLHEEYCMPCDNDQAESIEAHPTLIEPDEDEIVEENMWDMQEAIQPVDFDDKQTDITNEALDTAAVVSDDEDDDNIEDVTPQPRTTGSPSAESEGSRANEDPIIIADNPNDEVHATTPAGELLRYHYRLGHMSFAKIQEMAKRGDLPKKLANVKPPMCAACMFGKMCRRAWRTRAKNRKILTPTRPGQVVHVDQMESSTVGFIAQLKGRATKRRYKVATVFTDGATGYSYVHMQETSSSADTLKAKLAFEAHCNKLGVTVSHYHCDNGRFADNVWKSHVTSSGQTISYCGVNAHFQNGRSEKKIRDLREGARTSLLFAADKWKNTVTTALWPYAIRYQNDVMINTIGPDGTTPLMRFSGSNVLPNFKDFHTFGCPVYALDGDLASGKKISHWRPRARIGINLGFSPRHARTVSLVLNTQTGNVSPQFHIRHDDFFATVRGMKLKSRWQEAAGFVTSTIIKPFAQPAATSFQLTPSSSTSTTPPLSDPSTASQVQHEFEGEAHTTEDPDPTPPAPGQSATDQTLPEPSNQVPDQLGPSFNPHQPAQPTSVRRSSRQRTPSNKYRESVATGELHGFTADIDDDEFYDALHEEELGHQREMDDPIAYLAATTGKKGDKDTMYYHQAMAAPDRNEFIKAMRKEFADHTERDHWELITKSKVPKGVRILDAIWAMKRKRNIVTREIYKWKARLNVHGGQQEKGVNFWETYSPVVNWFSIRLLLAKAVMSKWHTRQIDFVLAYPQADIETELFMKLPRGIELPGVSNDTHCLRLKKNIYGQKQAGRVWVKHLQAGLRNIGFTPSKVDECVWYRDDVIFTFYVDDGIAWSPNEASVDKFLSDFRNEKLAGAKYDIEDKGNIADYLGIHFEETSNGKIHLSQPHLIQEIIDEVGVSNFKPRATPAQSSRILQRNLSGPEFDMNFNYRSIIGKLNFLEKGTRPDIAYAVHQLARFSANPRKCHGEAIVHLAKYLNGTKDKGLIINPDFKKSFEVWADADFCGNWNVDTAHVDPATAKSRAGYAVTLHGAPVIWHSKLISQICLSTTEAEYCCLSQSLRDTIPIMNMLQEMNDLGFLDTNAVPKIHCKAFEDNIGALELAKVPKMRPRTKHINLVFHHFREHVRRGLVSIHHVSTTLQIADMLTKPLEQNSFLRHRKKLLGW